MKEIDKIMKLYNAIEDTTEEEEILHAQQSLSAAFNALLDCVPGYIRGEVDSNSQTSKEKKSMKERIDDAEKALKTLNKYGAQYGIEFPLPKSKRDVALYVAGYGREIVFSDRNDP